MTSLHPDPDSEDEKVRMLNCYKVD